MNVAAAASTYCVIDRGESSRIDELQGEGREEGSEQNGWDDLKEEECDEIWWLEGDASWLGFRIMRIGEIEGDGLDGEKLR